MHQSHAPKDLLAKNFGVPASTFDISFPKSEVYFATGKIPPAVPSVPLQGRKPPPLTHKHSLLSQRPFETFKGGLEWRVDGSQFPISTTMTGVVLEMEAGALRELHWHPNAAEWQYILSGDFSVTMFGSKGRWRQESLSRGDVGYIPQDFGHSIENVGAGTARILIVFNSGHYQTIDLSQWNRRESDRHPRDQLFARFRHLREVPARGCLHDEIGSKQDDSDAIDQTDEDGMSFPLHEPIHAGRASRSIDSEKLQRTKRRVR